MEPRVRPVGVDDLDEIVGLAARARASMVTERGGAALLVDLGLRPDGSDIASLLDDRLSMVWCATLDEVPIGFLVAELVDRDGGRTVTIRELWVDPEARGVGSGESLATAAIAWAIAEEANAVDAYALPGAREVKNLFERLGLTARLLTVRRDLD